MNEDTLLCARDEIPPNRCETCDFCTMILQKEGTVVCNVMGFDCDMPWSPSKVNRCSEYQNLHDEIKELERVAIHYIGLPDL